MFGLMVVICWGPLWVGADGGCLLDVVGWVVGPSGSVVVGTGVGRRVGRCGSWGLSSGGSSLLFLHSNLCAPLPSSANFLWARWALHLDSFCTFHSVAA